MKLEAPPAAVPNILVVDDTPANLVVLCEMLQSKGYQPRPVPSGHGSYCCTHGTQFWRLR